MNQHRPSVIRFLIVAGLLCRHYDFEWAKKMLEEEEEEEQEEEDLKDTKEKRKQEIAINKKVLGVMIGFVQRMGLKVDVGVNSKCIIGMGHLLIRESDLMFQEEVNSIINQCLQKQTPPFFKINLLRSFAEMLHEEEERSKVHLLSSSSSSLSFFQFSTSSNRSNSQWYVDSSLFFQSSNQTSDKLFFFFCLIKRKVETRSSPRLL